MSTDNRFDETAECRRCHDQRIIIRRGLCSDCILEEVEAGTLDKNYPKNYPPGDDRERRDEAEEREQDNNQEEKAMSRGAKEEKQGRSTRACLKCGQVKMIIGRGLCGKCYLDERKEGTLDKNFPKARKAIPAMDTAKPKKKVKYPIGALPLGPARKTVTVDVRNSSLLAEPTHPQVVPVDNSLKKQAEDAIYPGRRLLLAALDALGEVAESLENAKLTETAQTVYAKIGRLEREARKACVL